MPILYLFSVTGYPTGIGDARASFGGFTDNQVYATAAIDLCKEAERDLPAQCGIALETSLDGRTLTVNAKVKSFISQACSLVVFVTEDNIAADQRSYDWDDPEVITGFVHNDVARACLSSFTGDAIALSSTATAAKTYTYSIPSKFNLSNCRVVAYIYAPYGDYINTHSVTNVSYLSGDAFASQYIANSASCPVGGSIDFRYE